MPVLVVVNHYKRPGNMPAVIQSWKRQSVPTHLVVVDNSLWTDPESYPNPVLHGADDIWRVRDNMGCVAKFAPALMLHRFEYVLFADDDFLPGERSVEFLLTVAGKLDFATLGSNGRLFLLDRPARQRYSGRSAPTRGRDPVRTHLTCQVHLVHQEDMPLVLEFRDCLVESFGDEARALVDIHDDFLLSIGIQFQRGMPSYVIPSEPSEAERLQLRRLEEPGAVWRRPEHFAERNRLVDMCLELGWRSR